MYVCIGTTFSLVILCLLGVCAEHSGGDLALYHLELVREAPGEQTAVHPSRDQVLAWWNKKRNNSGSVQI